MRVAISLSGGLAAGAALLLAARSPSSAWRSLATPGTAADPAAPVVATAALAAWLLAGWLALACALCLLARLPGVAGHAADELACRVAPAALRRLLAVGLGITVAAAPPAQASAVQGPVQPGSAPAGASLDWPGSSPPALARSAEPRSATPPAPAPGQDAAVVRVAPTGAVVVQAGDSLWRLAASALHASAGTAPTTAQVAAAWPSWWQVNRRVIGDDPHLLLPGSVLQPPAGTWPPA